MAENISFFYVRGHRLLDGISFSLAEGDILTILGPNGSGKSTLLDCVCGISPLKGGRVSVCGESVSSLSPVELARRVGYVPQLHAPAFDFPVRDYVVMGRAPYLGLLEAPGRREYEMTDAALESMGIAHLARKLCSEISGGERQQVQIARALVQEPKVILLDEPTSHLDYGNQIKVLKLVADLSDRGVTVILTTHVPDHPILLDGKVGVLDGKGGMRTGSVSEIIDERSLRDMYSVDLRLIYIEEMQRTACVIGKLSGAQGFAEKMLEV
ncbi:MAG: ABC transporter ATP-binding protein [Synergistaceae bacterium]|nr:ABC transporter ATP-binding protein [Synergistaceae bacterium]